MVPLQGSQHWNGGVTCKEGGVVVRTPAPRIVRRGPLPRCPWRGRASPRGAPIPLRCPVPARGRCPALLPERRGRRSHPAHLRKEWRGKHQGRTGLIAGLVERPSAVGARALPLVLGMACLPGQQTAAAGFCRRLMALLPHRRQERSILKQRIRCFSSSQNHGCTLRRHFQLGSAAESASAAYSRDFGCSVSYRSISGSSDAGVRYVPLLSATDS
jgi:hypothetical protein